MTQLLLSEDAKAQIEEKYFYKNRNNKCNTPVQSLPVCTAPQSEAFTQQW